MVSARSGPFFISLPAAFYHQQMPASPLRDDITFNHTYGELAGIRQELKHRLPDLRTWLGQRPPLLLQAVQTA